MRTSVINLRVNSLHAAASLAAAMLVAGCSDSPTSPIPAATGRVTMSATGDAVAGARVTIGDMTALTDAEGRYELTGLVEGLAKIRGTATGFEPFEADISISSGALTRDISLKRIELFEVGDFTLQISENVSQVRGVLVALGGPDTRGFASSRPFGAPLPQVESSLQTLGQQMRAMAASRGLAILGTSRAAMPNAAASDQAIIAAVQQAAASSGRADLSAAPFLVYGMSGGGPEASGFTSRNASRVAGLFLKAPLGIESMTSGPSLEVPVYVVLAGLDAFVDNAALQARYSENRGAGAPWALALEQGVPHHALSAAQSELTIQWMNTILGMRLGAAPSDGLRAISESSGWVGYPQTTVVVAWSGHTGNPRSASWFPSQSTAEKWRTFVRTGMSSPPGTGISPSCAASHAACFAFAREGAVFTTALDASPPVRVLEDATRPAWSPDGSMIAFTRRNRYTLGNWQMCVSGRDGAGVRCAVSEENGYVVAGPSWSSDAIHVAFSVFVHSCPAGQCGQLGGYFTRLKLLDTRTMQVTSVGTHEVHSVAWSPDGKRIAFAAWGVGQWGRGALHVMNADGSNVQFIGDALGAYSVSEIAWSPDGGRLALAMANENSCPWYCDTALGVVNADGSGLQLLATANTSHPGKTSDRYIDFPSWSPDGSQLAYTVSGMCNESEASCFTEIRGLNSAGGASYLLVPNAAAGSWRR